jgi:heme exporter protein D
MMPELGKYAGAVMGSYVASLALILGFVALSLWQARRMKRALDEVEKRQGKAHE